MTDALVDARLVELEEVIERGIATFVEVGEALLEIRDSRLYRETHPTFEAYCKERWGWTASHSRRLIDASQVVAQIAPTGAIPTSEWQARELVPLKGQPQVMRDVWSDVLARAERDETPITGPVIRNAVREHIRKMAAESETEMLAATAHWTDEQRATVAPELMRQRGELMRLVHDLVVLPEPVAYAKTHGAHLPSKFLAEAEYARDWLDSLCKALEGEK